MEKVEEVTGHVGVTVVEAIGHGRERGVTHGHLGTHHRPPPARVPAPGAEPVTGAV